MLTNTGRSILRAVEKYSLELYASLEKFAEYPNEDDFVVPRDYNSAVDKAELKALQELINEELGG